jgi:adenylate kinase family enzyme
MKMAQDIYLICGVPGSGKTWVCEQLKDKFNYIPHDLHYTKHADVILEEAKHSLKPIITEVPFGERLLKEDLEKRGANIKTVFILEHPQVVKQRYEAREKKRIPQSFLTRSSTIHKRAMEWSAPMGNSKEILDYLKNIEI